ncbi:MAG: UbiA family prenyltransferase [Dehalococcoidia bacterium]
MSHARDAAGWPRWVALLKIIKVPFCIFWITPIIFGFIASADDPSASRLFWLTAAVLGTFALEGLNCLHNELKDREEDAVNQPARRELLDSWSEATLWRTVIVGYAVCAVGLIWFAVFVSPWIPVLMLAGGVFAPLYNWGPRFKRRPVLAELTMGWSLFMGYVQGFFLATADGWDLGHSFSDLPVVIGVCVYIEIVTNFFKDLPDVRGDERVGAPGLFSVRGRWVRSALLLWITLSPYLLIGGLVGVDVLPERFLLAGVTLPVAVLLAVLAERADTEDTWIVTYELAFLYLHAVLVFLFVLDSPGAAAVAAGAALVTSRWLAIYLGLAPRFVNPEFSWGGATRELWQKAWQGAK